MFASAILKIIESDQTRDNSLTDGRYRCAYRELSAIFAQLDRFFATANVSLDEGSILSVRNTLPDAIVILWMLSRQKDALLLPRIHPRGQIELQNTSLPVFCKNRISTSMSSSNLRLLDPNSYLRLETNANYKGKTEAMRGVGNLFLKTSGSTSKPKLVGHSNRGLHKNARNCASRLELSRDDRIMIPVPIYHMYGLGAALLPAVISGASVNLLDGTNVLTYADRERTFKASMSFLTPPLCEMLLRTPQLAYKYRLAITAGDRINRAIFEQFEEKYGKLINLYGSTELGVIATSKLNDPPVVRSKGLVIPLPHVAMSLRDIGPPAADGAVSEILCKHEFGFETYLDMEGRKISRAHDETNWFKTKDLGRRFENNQFDVVGRSDNSINRNGILIAFSEIESIMAQNIKEIRHVVVVAAEEENYRGKKIVAYCEPEPSAKCSEKSIRSRCFRIMMRHVVPDEVYLVKHIPRLNSGKVDRGALGRKSMA